jgi:hypothetical protein
MTYNLLEPVVQVTGLIATIVMPMVLTAVCLINYGKTKLTLAKNPEATIGTRPTTVPKLSEGAAAAPWIKDDDLIASKVPAEGTPPVSIKELLLSMNKDPPTKLNADPFDLEDSQETKSERQETTKDPIAIEPPVKAITLSQVIEDQHPMMNIELELTKNQKIEVYGKEWMIKTATLKIEPSSTPALPLPDKRLALEEKDLEPTDEDFTDDVRNGESIDLAKYKPDYLRIGKKRTTTNDEAEHKDMQVTS